MEDGKPELALTYNALRSEVRCIYMHACCLPWGDLGCGLRSRLNSLIYTSVDPSRVPLCSANPDLKEMKTIIPAEVYFMTLICNRGGDLGDLMKDIMSSVPTSFGDSDLAYAVVVSAVVLLYFVYQYLIGYVDRGGSKAYSSGSLEFRDTYISIVLFQGAYIWIKFRDVIPRGAVYHRPGSSKYEPRIKLPVMKNVGSSEAQQSRRLCLGSFGTHSEAETVYRIAAFYCGKQARGRLDLGDGRYFTIPAMSEGDQSVSYREKVKQVEVQGL